jgi:tellurite resistance protein
VAVDVVHVLLHLLDKMWRYRRALLEDMKEVAKEVIHACAPVARALDEAESSFAQAMVRFAARNLPLLRGFASGEEGAGAELMLEKLNELVDKAQTLEEIREVTRAVRLYAYTLLIAYRLYIGKELELIREAKKLPAELEAL